MSLRNLRIQVAKSQIANYKLQMCTLNQLQQHASGALGVHENVAMAASSGLDFFRDETNAILFQFGNRGRQVGNAQADVVQALAAFGDEFGDG